MSRPFLRQIPDSVSTPPIPPRLVRCSVALGTALLLTMGCVSEPLPLHLTSATRDQPDDPRDRAAYDNLVEALETGALTGTRADWTRVRRAWERSADLPERLAVLGADPVEQAALDLERAGARLDAWTGDLAARRALAEQDERHARAAALLMEAIDATGRGTDSAPWQVSTALDAVALLESRGLSVVGGYYGVPSERRLTLVLLARRGPHPAAVGDLENPTAREYVFDLSATLAAWHGARRYRGALGRISSRALLDQLAAAGDGFALTSRGLLVATEQGPGSHYAAAEQLQRAALAGNAVAHCTLGDLFLQLAARPARAGTSIPEVARASARTHYLAAAGLGAPYAHFKLGLLALEDGDRLRARDHLEQARSGGDRAATRELVALLRESGEQERALALLAGLAEDGDIDGGYTLALWQLEERRVTDPLALQALEANLRSGHAPSIALLGDLHARGLHVERDHGRALELWRSAAMSSREPMLVEAIARALVLNRAATLHDPQAAADALERVLRYRDARDCARCFATLAGARLAMGERKAARDAYGLGLEAARRNPDAEALDALRELGMELAVDEQEMAQL